MESAGVSFRPSGESSRARPEETRPPVALTASDGTGLELTDFSAKGVVEGPLAFTELRLRFRNPEPRVREGRFRIVLPEGASISRFAMRIGDRWQEGEVVERQKARRVYEDFLHRRQDPALLEHSAGNEFTARVFPIAPNATKALIVSYSHELLRKSEPYRIPLLGLPQLERLDIQVQVAEASVGPAKSSLEGTVLKRETVRVKKERWVPTQDFEVPAPSALGSGLRHENLVLARLKIPEGSKGGAAPMSGLTVLVDTSASRALGYETQLTVLEHLASALARGRGEETPLRVVAFDQTTASVFEGRAGSFGSKALNALRARHALGATHLSQALEWLQAHTQPGRYDRLLLVSDGVVTAGDLDASVDAVEALKHSGFRRLDALALGGLRDSDGLRRLAHGRLPAAGKVIDGRRPMAEITRQLNQATLVGLNVEVEDARWVWPQTLHGVQPGDEVLVYADLPAGQSFALKLNDEPYPIDDEALTRAPRPLLERAWVRARMARLLDRRARLDPEDQDMRGALAEQVTQLSVRHRVISPFTALLVLETARDYQRYGIERNGLADILTVGSEGLTLLAERGMPPVSPSPGEDRKGRASSERPRTERRPTDQPRTGPTPTTRPQTGPTPRDQPTPRTPADQPPTGPTPLGAGPELEPLSARDETSEAGARADPVGARGTLSGAGSALAAAPPSARHARSEVGREADLNDRASFAEKAGGTDRRRQLTPAVLREEVGDGSVSRRPGPADAFREPPQEPEALRTQDVSTKRKSTPALGGRFAAFRALLLSPDGTSQALDAARAWRQENPGDVLALVALGEALEKGASLADAARAYGSIIDLFPARADMLRFAAGRLESLETQAALELAADAYERAVAQRPDHPSAHRGLAFARLKLGAPEAAFKALERGLRERYPNRFPGVMRILKEDLGLIARVWQVQAPDRFREISERLEAAGGVAPEGPSLRFVLTWETDANDVDFHIHDGRDGHAFYQQKQLPSGGDLYADVTTGYGPECFTISGKAKAFPYRLEAHYYRRGPMGYGMGRVQIIDHDGKGGLKFDERPFVAMNDGAYVELGEVRVP